ncbi:DUF1302 family protein [Chitinimonas sp.]|uniref:DUF1302 family protein n=1 Tax=Chitinimonas sp. TaxID=1934313 RepID=UPI002F925C03
MRHKHRPHRHRKVALHLALALSPVFGSCWASAYPDPASLTAAVALPLSDQASGFDLHGNFRTRGGTQLAMEEGAEKKAGSRDALFDDDPLEQTAPDKPAPRQGSPLKGYLQAEAARTTAEPDHWSKLRLLADLSAQGQFGGGVKWKLGGRFAYDGAYDRGNYYPADVARNQRYDIALRENYIDFGADEWDFRVGRQHVVWGEMVGLFFADVVSARDMREFILPEFDALRTPQWATRAEYFKDDFHAEFLWVPVASYDQIGKPGADFYPYPPMPTDVPVLFRAEQRPKRNLDHTNYGVRLSTLKDGWDVSGFAYSSMDVNPTFYRQIALVPQPTVIFEARHDRIQQYGGTLAKDFGSFVLKSEAVYTHGRKLNAQRLNAEDGLVPQNMLDWAIGLDFNPQDDMRFNVQLFQRDIFSRDPDVLPKQHESGYSLLLNYKFTDKLEAQAIWISSLNRTDWLLRPRITWSFEKNWRLVVGSDLFKGPEQGLFGRFDQADRVYSELRYSF